MDKPTSQIHSIVLNYTLQSHGTLNKNEFSLLIKDLNLQVPDIDALFNQLDTLKTGAVPYQNFIQHILQRKETDIQLTNIIQSPATQIVSIMRKLQASQSEKEKEEIEWAITKIEHNAIYKCAFEESGFESSSDEGEDDLVGWLNEYSSKKCMLPIGVYGTNDTQSIEASIHSINDQLEKHKEILKDLDNIDVDMFEMSDRLGRENTLPLVAYYILNSHKLLEIVDQKRLATFINQIYLGYRKDTSYHTDIHSADVTQMCHIFITMGGLQNLCKLTPFDKLGFLISAIIHDYKHMGLTNAFHESSRSSLATRYNDISILENYHIAQAFKLMNNDIMNIFYGMSLENKRAIKKQIIHCVLSTDMQKHAAQMAMLKSLITSKSIKDGKNAESIIDQSTPIKAIESRNDMLGAMLHAADVSNSARSFPICKKWTMKLMEEFWRQGDLEKQMLLPISFLCDRTTANIPASQIGFINGITKPMFSMLADIMPHLSIYVDILCENELNWRMLQIHDKLSKIAPLDEKVEPESSKKRNSLQETSIKLGKDS